MTRRGVTLIELIVVLAIIAAIADVTMLAFRRAKFGPTIEPWVNTLAQARQTALGSGHSVGLTIRIRDTLFAATALPDGSIVADPRLGIDRLIGAAPHAP